MERWVFNTLVIHSYIPIQYLTERALVIKKKMS